jgi:murein L,D-transpeptidase YafK
MIHTLHLALVLLFAAQGDNPARRVVPDLSRDEVRADRIVVYKKLRTMHLMNKGQILHTYNIALGGSPEGPKQRQGDHKTPEGHYTIDSRNSRSQFHLALHISYPNAADRARARRMGVSPGGAIMIHGLPNGFASLGSAHTLTDWTDGCIAVTNQEIEEIWRLVPLKTPIEILP